MLTRAFTYIVTNVPCILVRMWWTDGLSMNFGHEPSFIMKDWT